MSPLLHIAFYNSTSRAHSTYNAPLAKWLALAAACWRQQTGGGDGWWYGGLRGPPHAVRRSTMRIDPRTRKTQKACARQVTANFCVRVESSILMLFGLARSVCCGTGWLVRISEAVGISEMPCWQQVAAAAGGNHAFGNAPARFSVAGRTNMGAGATRGWDGNWAAMGGGGGGGWAARWHHHMPPAGIIICRQLASSGKLDIIPCQSYALRSILSFVILPWALIIECFHQCFHPAASPAWAPETPALPSLPAPAAGI